MSIEQTHPFESALIDMIPFPLISISFALGSGAWKWGLGSPVITTSYFSSLEHIPRAIPLFWFGLVCFDLIVLGGRWDELVSFV